MSAFEIRIDNQWLSALNPRWGEPRVTWRWPYGSYQLDFSAIFKPGARPAAFRVGAPVDVFVNGRRCWVGTLTEPAWATGEFHAEGLARQAEGAICLRTDGQVTSVPDEAIDYAIAHGWIDWTRPASLSAAALSGTDEPTMRYLLDLLNAWADEAGKRWYVAPDRRVLAAADPTSPSYLINPDVEALGVASDAIAGSLAGRWQDAGGVLHTTIVGDGLPVVDRDLTIYGPMDATRATSILTNMLAKIGPLGGWANSLPLEASLITTRGSTQPALWEVGEHVGRGCMIRLLGQRDPRAIAAHIDVVVGEAIWDVEDELLTLSPVGLAARDIDKITEEAAAA